MHRSVRMKAAFAVAAVVALGAGAGNAHAAGKNFSLKVTPGEVGQNTDASVLATVINDSTEGHKLGSANLIAPSEFDITGIGLPSSGTAKLVGNQVELRNLSLTGGKSVTLKVAIGTADTEGKFPWVASAKSSQTYAEKESPWGEVVANTTVDSTTESKKECSGGPCSLTQRHTVSAGWVDALKRKAGQSEPALVGDATADAHGVTEPASPYWVETTVQTKEAGPLTLRYLNPETESAMNSASACNGLDDNDPLKSPYVEPSDAAALYDGPNAAKTVEYEISAELWQLVLLAGGELDACFSAPFAFTTEFPDPVFLVGTTPWFNGLLRDCAEDPPQTSGVCIDRPRSHAPKVDEDAAAKVTIELHPPFAPGTDPMSR